MNQKIIFLAIAVIILFIGGVWFATILPDKKSPEDSNQPLDTTRGKPLFSDLRIGTPVRASFATQKNPPIKQKMDYTVNEPIMLQGSVISSVTKPITVSARLVDSASKITELQPASITLGPGTTSYCCWTISTPGIYTVQVLRPDSITTALPITITRDLSAIEQDEIHR